MAIQTAEIYTMCHFSSNLLDTGLHPSNIDFKTEIWAGYFATAAFRPDSITAFFSRFHFSSRLVTHVRTRDYTVATLEISRWCRWIELLGWIANLPKGLLKLQLFYSANFCSQSPHNAEDPKYYWWILPWYIQHHHLLLVNSTFCRETSNLHFCCSMFFPLHHRSIVDLENHGIL